MGPNGYERKNHAPANPNPNRNEPPIEDASAQRVRDILEGTHDIAAMDDHAETQKALGRRTIIVDPEALLQCATHIKTSNQGRLRDAMNKEMTY